MKKKTWQLVLLGILVLVVAGGLIAYLNGGPGKSKNTVKVAEKAQKPAQVKDSKAGPVPSASVNTPTPSGYTGKEGKDSPERVARLMDELSRIRGNPTTENVQALVDLLGKEKNRLILSTAIDALGAIAFQHKEFKEQALKVLSEKAMDSNFSQRAQALLASAVIGKDRVLPMVSDLIQEKEMDLSDEHGGKQEVISRALNLIATPACVPLLTKIIDGASDLSTRRNSYAALGRIGTPDALAFLQQQAQNTSGADQAASVTALARSKDTATRQWIEGAILDGTLGTDAVKALAFSPAAPDIFGNVMASGGLDPAKKLGMLQQIDSAAIMAPADVREKLAVAIAPLAYSNDAKLQKEAIKVVGQLGGKDVSDVLQPFLRSDDPEVRKDAFFSYLRFTRPDNYHYLFDFLNDPDQNTRRTAMLTIGRFYTQADRSALEQAARSQDPYISEKAQQFLSRLN